MLDFVPGHDIFAQLSELNHAVNALFTLLMVIVMATVAVTIFIALDGRFIGSTLVSQAIVMWGGLAIVSPVIARRASFRARWGARAFSIVFRWFVIPGLTVIFVGLAHFAWIEGGRVIPREIALP